jgi:hypothetical protein
MSQEKPPFTVGDIVVNFAAPNKWYVIECIDLREYGWAARFRPILRNGRDDIHAGRDIYWGLLTTKGYSRVPDEELLHLSKGNLRRRLQQAARLQEAQEQNEQSPQDQAWHDADQHLQISKAILKYGFSVQWSAASPSYAYTIGLAPSMPELLLFGWPIDQALTIFHRVTEIYRYEQVIFTSGNIYYDILQSVPCYFHQVEQDCYEQYVAEAIRWHGNRSFPLLQIVWTYAGLFPWQTGYASPTEQPLLFRLKN